MIKDLSLATPWALLAWIPVLAVFLERWWWRRRGRAPALKYASVGLFDGVPTTLAARLWWLPDAVRALALCALVFALARPQLVGEAEKEDAEGIDIVLALDVSCSMNAADFQPQDRMYVAKKSVGEFIGTRKTDRVALVVFGGEAATWVPLTLDYSLVAELLEEIETGMVADGTAIGNAIGTALNRLRSSDAKSKVVVLLTDGDSNAGEISPIAAANLARDAGVKVYTIGAGTNGRAPIRVPDAFGNTQLVTVPVQIDEATLGEMAKTTGGAYFRATDAGGLRKIYGEIDRLTRVEISETKYADYRQFYGYFVVLAMLAIGFAVTLRSTILRRLP